MGSLCSRGVSDRVFDLFEDVAFDMLISNPDARAKLLTAYEKYDRYPRADRQRIDKMMTHLLQSLPAKSNKPNGLNELDKPDEPPKLTRQNAVEQL